MQETKRIQFRARTDTETLFKLAQNQFSQTQTGVFLKSLVQGTVSIL